ncbi:response regulator transcription factor [Lactobacillus gigeriorum]|uniref:DNA-binding response regulator n=1 Tax=Lactobacillus gigeriorum DSM 23908 = CRBIP 24.85 TaxID=1423751 RepID=I7KMK4_9LACO|nr:response regulator transcription factor [Lactobacillus gigeriorum]KRN14126.1 DNA-binding response regulator [Lactobacillus gigeriorum DSM 23908 = CRBIP 24.85]CCI86139.1 DNA-binding response regulator, OmpR family (Rec-wHTH domains) [Lactobacillus gigeriorum DSM 23908 = CRBIP 24.85]
MRILLAEDEPQLNRVVKVALESVGYQVDTVFDGEQAISAAKSNPYDVIILDIMMPVLDGIEVLKQIRANGDKTYVMMLTAKAEIDDRVIGLESGADDYLTKPFSLKELIARLRSRERRDAEYQVTEMDYSDLHLNTDQQELVAHNSIRLASKEVDLLSYLILNSEKAISNQEILDHVWKDDPLADSELVWIYISYLRQKMTSIGSKVKIIGEKNGEFVLTK